jgi:uncharacterized protein (TIGR03435 family)
MIKVGQIKWTNSISSGDVQFDIVGKAASDTSQDTLRVMTQNLLAERLKLALHRDKRQLPFLALVVVKSGPKLTPAKERACRVPRNSEQFLS